MYREMYEAYHEAAEQSGALIADVGKRFYEIADQQDISLRKMDAIQTSWDLRLLHRSLRM